MILSPLHRALVRVPRATAVDLTGKKVVVTGAAPGSIGGETAKALRSWGAEVITTTRSVAITRTEHPLDLVDPSSVVAFSRWYAETHGDRLDVLVNNAGVHLDLMNSWKQPRLSPDGYELHWRINYLGTMHLMHLLLPLIPRGGRVVNVVSHLHHRGKNSELLAPPASYSSWDAYGRSKLALVHATKELQRRYPELGAYSVHPGAVYTDIATKGLSEHPRISAIRSALKPVEAFFLLTAEEGAQTSITCATQDGLKGGAYFVKSRAKDPNPEAHDAAVSRALWDQTDDWLAALVS